MGMTTDGLSLWQAETESIDLLQTTIGALLDQRAQEVPHQEAIVYSGYPEFGEALSLRWTYAAYRERANAVAKGLLALGLKPGEHIAVWAANLPEWLLLQMAAAKVGLVLVTINPVLRGEEVAYILQHGNVRALFFMAQVRDHDCLAPMRGLTTPDDPFELKAATVGLPLPRVAVKIIDPASGAIVPCRKRGELCLRGYLVMQGYYELPERTAEAIDREGWLHTGDLATMNAQGYVNIVGRLKEMVIRGGENLFPAEIEAFLLRHPKVAEVAVLGVPDSYFGEELLAAVRPKTGETLTEEDLRAFCTGQLSHQKIPRYFQFVESFPLTGSGKVQKFVLREQAIKTLGLERAAQIKTA